MIIYIFLLIFKEYNHFIFDFNVILLISIHHLKIVNFFCRLTILILFDKFLLLLCYRFTWGSIIQTFSNFIMSILVYYEIIIFVPSDKFWNTCLTHLCFSIPSIHIFHNHNNKPYWSWFLTERFYIQKKTFNSKIKLI